MKRILLPLIISLLSSSFVCGQNEVAIHSQPTPFSFAYFADTHITEGAQSVEDLQLCIKDINNNPDLHFVIVAGDITEFGSDRELKLAKSIFDKLNKPYYVVAGNHDSKWSESGCNTFSKVFGYEHFDFEAKGIKFIGCSSGPNMRMAPALVPRESIVWLDSLVRNTDPIKPIIFVNHFPMDTSVLNYFQVLNILKESNIQLVMGGHWHRDVALNYDGIPGVLGRSSQARGRDGAGYNIVSILGSQIIIEERIAGKVTKNSWFSMQMSDAAPFNARVKTETKLPEYTSNSSYPNVKEIWSIQEKSDIGAGGAVNKKFVVYTNTKGEVVCLNKQVGKELWRVPTGGKIFSTPAISGNRVVVGSTDNNVYCFDIKTGKTLWKHLCDKSVLASPAIYKGVVYIGASDGRFRALSLKTGKMIWNYPDVKGFVEAKPYVDDYQVVIGDWGNQLYSFETKTGKLQWIWSNKGSRMYSPAAVYPVKANNKIFFVTPERSTYGVEATSGSTFWSAPGGRESIGISPNGGTVYVKTMKDTVIAFSTSSRFSERVWAVDAGIKYDISPTPITCQPLEKKMKEWQIFIPTDKGDIVSLSSENGKVLWRYKLSHALINSILPLPKKELLITTMDGKVILISY